VLATATLTDRPPSRAWAVARYTRREPNLPASGMAFNPAKMRSRALSSGSGSRVRLSRSHRRQRASHTGNEGGHITGELSSCAARTRRKSRPSACKDKTWSMQLDRFKIYDGITWFGSSVTEPSFRWLIARSNHRSREILEWNPTTGRGELVWCCRNR
jgi:hypothetical protein